MSYGIQFNITMYYHDEASINTKEVIPDADSYSDSPASAVPDRTVEHEPYKPVGSKDEGSKRPRLSFRRVLLYFLILLALLTIIAGSMYAIFGGLGTLSIDSDKVSVIYVQGIMITGNIPGGFGFATSEDICKNIQDAADDRTVKSIVLRINSPGGSAAAAQEIVTEIEKAQEKKPVVVSMGDVAASAAYHISAPTDRIIANPDTLTGSIGVIWIFENRSAFYEEEGIEFYVAKSGEFKDMGGNWRGLTDEEKHYSEQVILEIYQRFVDVVADSRNMSTSEVKDLADGRIYTGSKAVELGLVDETGNLYDAIEIASKLGGIEGDYTVRYKNKPSLSNLLFGGSEEMDDPARMVLRYWYESPYGRIV